MLPISMSSSTTNRRAFPISSLQLYVHRTQMAGGLRIAAHGFDRLWCHFFLEGTESAQAKSVFLRDHTNLFYTFSCKMFAQRIILKASFQSKGDCFCHTGIGLARREAKVKMEVNGSGHINHSAVNH